MGAAIGGSGRPASESLYPWGRATASIHELRQVFLAPLDATAKFLLADRGKGAMLETA